jgi:hypothetical protein
MVGEIVLAVLPKIEFELSEGVYNGEWQQWDDDRDEASTASGWEPHDQPPFFVTHHRYFSVYHRRV